MTLRAGSRSRAPNLRRGQLLALDRARHCSTRMAMCFSLRLMPEALSRVAGRTREDPLHLLPEGLTEPGPVGGIAEGVLLTGIHTQQILTPAQTGPQVAEPVGRLDHEGEALRSVRRHLRQ